MEFFWVNIGLTYKEVLENNFLWAPVSSINKNGTEVRHEHWDNVAKVKAGDVIFCCHKQRISFVAKVTKNAFLAPRPANRSFQEWGQDGHRVDVNLIHLHRPVLRDDISTDFINSFDARTSPALFTVKATLNQIYMAHLPADAGLFLLEATQLIADFEDKLISAGATQKEVAATTREALIQARIGQGKFRADLMKRWNGKCSLTGLKSGDLLVASHIVAWSLCDNIARLDPDNGLLLAVHIDRLFDRGLISFTSAGKLLISNRLTEADQHVFGLDKFPQLRQLTIGNKHYLAKHRERFAFE